MITIDFIQTPYAFTSDGKRLHFSDIIGTPRVGACLEPLDNGKYQVTMSMTDSDCVGGVCPIR